MKWLLILLAPLCVSGCYHPRHQPPDRTTLNPTINRINQQQAIEIAKRIVADKENCTTDAVNVLLYPGAPSGWRFIVYGIPTKDGRIKSRLIEIDYAGKLTHYSGC